MEFSPSATMEHFFFSTKETTLSGNLVLIDVNDTSNSSESYLWKSFDYPFNTWLPSMMIGKDTSNGLDRFLTSCSDSDIASPGDFTYKFD